MKMNTEELIETLDRLRTQYKILTKSPIKVQDLERIPALQIEILAVERNLAAARNEPYAALWEWPIALTFSTYPSPIVVSQGLKTLLIYEALPKEKNDRSQHTAIVTFGDCVGCKYSDLNDEVIEGNPLYGRGIEVGGAYIVMNSPWLEEIKKIHSAHHMFNEKLWVRKRHYLLFFKESTFECIAEDVTSQLKDGPLHEIIYTETRNLYLTRTS
jgi:hypothetical protein